MILNWGAVNLLKNNVINNVYLALFFKNNYLRN